ncbi:MAG: ankyrin repeat domain-containing protein [Bacteroidetes bacterium]|nr:ankyrin repeat domain-containing protein [Bacteroidota bacterium]
MRRLITILLLIALVQFTARAQHSFREAAEAIANDDLLTLKSFVKEQPSLAMAHDSVSRSTLLHLAASRGADDVCNFLIRSHANVNARDSVGGTPLEAAVYRDRLTVVKILVEAGADVHLGRTRNNAFFLSLWQRDTSLVRYLLDHGCSATEPDERGTRPLDVAASFGTIDIMRVLLSAGAEVCNGHRDSCATAWWAAIDPEVEKMEYVRSLGADLNFRSSSGVTVLQQALDLGNWNVAMFLAGHGARVVTADDTLPVLCRIVGRSDDTSLVAYFFHRGASVNAVATRTGSAALSIAIENKNRSVAAWLLEHGADPAYINKNGESALAIAQRMGEQEIAASILKRQR